VFEVIWQKAASLSSHPSRRRMHSSAACAGQACGKYIMTGWHMSPSQVSIPMGVSGPHHTWFLGLAWVAPQTASQSVQPLCTAHSCAQDIHTQTHRDHGMYNICSNRPHLCTACRCCKIKMHIWVLNLAQNSDFKKTQKVSQLILFYCITPKFFLATLGPWPPGPPSCNSANIQWCWQALE